MHRNARILVAFAIFGLVAGIPSGGRSTYDEPSDEPSDEDLCLDEMEMSKEDFEGYVAAATFNQYDSKLACYALCIAKKSGRANDDGIIEKSTFVSKRPRRSADFCNEKKVEGDPCQTFYQQYTCYFLAE